MELVKAFCLFVCFIHIHNILPDVFVHNKVENGF